jgi:hypothetical protein
MRTTHISLTVVSGKLKIGLTHVNEIIAGLAHKKVCAQWVLHHLTLKMQTADWKYVRGYSHTMKMTVMIFWTALSWETTVGCINMAQN